LRSVCDVISFFFLSFPHPDFSVYNFNNNKTFGHFQGIVVVCTANTLFPRSHAFFFLICSNDRLKLRRQKKLMINLYSRILQRSSSATLRLLCASFPVLLAADFALRRQATYYRSRPLITTTSSQTAVPVNALFGQPVTPVKNAKGEVCGYKM
jgi:hypothetical protein